MLPPPPKNLPFTSLLMRILVENINPTHAFSSRLGTLPDPGRIQQVETPNSGLQNACNVDYKDLREIYFFGSAQGSGLS